ncbi:MAG: diguanylate cyclase [Candidatus Omnitrophica bacterium]|nr:diguanylate cyclase [Candidatus Omnitrophota bacterium]
MVEAQKNTLRKIIAGTSGAFIILVLFIFDWLHPLEMLSYDLRFKLRGAEPSLPQISIIEIDNKSVQVFGRWPWPRTYHGALISILYESGVRGLLYDVLFPEPSVSGEDEVLAMALKLSDCVYLPYAFETENEAGKFVYGEVYQPIRLFAESCKGMGHINVQPDPDGVFRRIPLVIERDSKLYPAVALSFFLNIVGADFEDLRYQKGKIIIPLHGGKEMEVEVDGQNQMLINWSGYWKDTFRHYSFANVIQSFRYEKEGKAPSIELGSFRDTLTLVGMTGIGLTDLKPMPFESVYPGIGLHANVLQNLLKKNWMRTSGRATNAMILLLASLVTTLGLLRLKPMTGILFVFLVIGAYLAIAFACFAFARLWVSVVYPVMAIVASYIVLLFYSQISLAVERNRFFRMATRDSLTGLFNLAHFKGLLEAEFHVSEEKKKPLCVIMLDIDHFKNFNDQYGHQTGDLILRDTARVFRSSGRETDVSARYGGEEMIMMLPDTKIEEALEIAERIRKNIESYEWKNYSYKVTVSLGVSWLESDNDIEELIKRADDALYRAKRKGRNRVEMAQKSVG